MMATFGGWVFEASDEELIKAQRQIETDFSIKTNPYSAAAFFGFHKCVQQLESNKSHVIILTS